MSNETPGEGTAPEPRAQKEAAPVPPHEGAVGAAADIMRDLGLVTSAVNIKLLPASEEKQRRSGDNDNKRCST